MIDTDKYEGHTHGIRFELHPSGWWVEWVEPCTWYIRDPEVHLVGSEANRLLIQDAPLLLDAYKQLREEVKQLREELDETEYRLEMAEDVLGRSDWFSVYSELIKEEE
tara:strand:- start:1935 stop:2258 length:324 start_codon:yes stop_codon:yes gene_type:complete